MPGTLRDSLVLLAVVLGQQTDLQPKQIMTDTGAYSDVVFGPFRLLGCRFSPRLANVGGARLWRIDSKADYGLLNSVSGHNISLQKTEPHWGEGRHSVARAAFHGKRGELRQHNREGQEEQLGALGLLPNMIVLWNTSYMEVALTQLRAHGFGLCATRPAMSRMASRDTAKNDT